MIERLALPLTSHAGHSQALRRCYSTLTPCRPGTRPLLSLPQPHNNLTRQSARTFSTTSSRHAQEANHYETLGVTPGVSKAELKKRFYVLSKETHPDLHPDDPKGAADRFAKVSEAYSVLGNDDKRRQYDRDVMPRFSPRQGHSRSSAQSGNFAGSRPATGLSKRRGTFRGPPPSFYARNNADTSNMSEQERANEFARREQAAYDRAAKAGQFDAGSYTESGQWDPTFNPTPIYRTQTAEDKRRQGRREAEMAAAQAFAEEQSHFWERFIVVSGIIGLGVGVGTFIQRMSAAPRGGMTRADGSMRS